MKKELFELSNKIKHAAQSVGFDDCGIAKSQYLAEDAFRLTEWLKNGYHAGMQYMENYFDKRTDPGKLVPGAKSVISVLLNYLPKETQPEKDNFIISKYAYGQDYHRIIKSKLKKLIHIINTTITPVNGRAFVDSAPLLDRAWAYKAGLGWIGKNTNLISPEYGSFVFIGTLIVDIELAYDKPLPDRCGKCTKCITSCPTNALITERRLDSEKCISYLTIENKNEIPAIMKGKFEGRIFGCDICQDVCPWNKKVKPHYVPEFQPSPDLLKLTKKDWEKLSYEEFRNLFGQSAVKRAKFSGLKRNISFISDD